MKALYKCFYCEEDFIEEEEIYVICNLKLEYSPIDKKLHWRYIKQSDYLIRIEKYFHRECFEKIAGDEYIGGKIN